MPIPPSTSNIAANGAPATVTSRSKLSLGTRFVITLLLGALAIAAGLFLPAGTLNFWQAWVYMAVLILPILYTYSYFLKHDPQMLQRRLKNDEQVTGQRLLMLFTRLFSLAILLLPGFDYRFGWSRSLFGPLPQWLTWLSMALVLAGISGALWVMNINRFAGATIGVEAGQGVISTGPYRIVRHPMYAAGTVLWVFTPLALGSTISLPGFALVIPFCVLRIRNEEKVLREQLPGYSEYCLRTRYRLIPFVW